MKRLRRSIFLPLILWLSACSFSLAEDLKPPAGSEVLPAPGAQSEPINAPVYPLVPPDPTLGAPIYAEKCAPCHGANGMGDGPSAADLSVPVAALGDPQLARQRTPAEWFNIVTNGNIERFMPPFTSLTDRQRWDVVAYAFSLSEPAVRLEEGETLYQANCTDCHGETGMGDGRLASEVAVPIADFTSQEFMADESMVALADAIRQGVGEAMPAYEDQFSENEIWALSAYIRSLGFAQQDVAKTAGEQADESTPEATTANAAMEATQTATAQNPTGSIKVSVLDESGNPVREEVEITLYAFENMEFIYSTTATTNAEGWSLFEDVEMPSSRVFLSSVNYKDVTYGSDVATPVNLEEPVELTVTVYETTTDTSALVVDRLHIFFDYTLPESVQVVELYIMRNLAEETIVSAEEGGAVLNFYLPEGAANIQFQDGGAGERYLLTEEGFADTQPIQPGEEHQVVFAYDIPYERKFHFTQKQDLSVNSAIILVPDGVKVRGDNLIESGLRDVQGASYFMYSMNTPPANDEIRLEISGSPKGRGAVSDNRLNLMIGLGALGIAMVVAGIWLFRRERYKEDMDDFDEEAEDEAEEMETPEEIMDAIIALDDMYKAGELLDEAYNQRRALLKERLAQRFDEG